MKYLCLAYEDEQPFHDLTEEEWRALRQETLDYVDSLRRSGHLVLTHALRGAGTARTVRVRGGRTSVTDGPFAEAREHIGGFFLIEAESHDEALRIAAAWPSARIGGIEVRPVQEELPMDRRYPST